MPAFSTNPSPGSGAGSEADAPTVLMSSGSICDRTKIVDTTDSEPMDEFFDALSDPL